MRRLDVVLPADEARGFSSEQDLRDAAASAGVDLAIKDTYGRPLEFAVDERGCIWMRNLGRDGVAEERGRADEAASGPHGDSAYDRDVVLRKCDGEWSVLARSTIHADYDWPAGR